MTSYQFNNNAQSTLALALTAGATSLSVDSAGPFPTSGDFTIIIDSEILLVTGVAGTIFTVARAQEGTSAAAHPQGATVQHILTADFLNSVREGMVLAGTAFPLSPSAGDRFFRTDLGGEFYYDGARWLSSWVEVLPMQAQGGTNPISATATTWGGLPPLDILLESVSVTFYVDAPNDVSNHWRFTLHYADLSTIVQIGTAITTVGFGTGGYTKVSWSSLSQVLPTAIDAMYVVATKVGAPGPCYRMVAGRYRLIAT